MSYLCRVTPLARVPTLSIAYLVSLATGLFELNEQSYLLLGHQT